MRPLPTSEVSSLIIAVKMAGSRRTLRSNEIQLSPNGLTDTELELHFSLQVKIITNLLIEVTQAEKAMQLAFPICALFYIKIIWKNKT